jgi:hypothetical protein
MPYRSKDFLAWVHAHRSGDPCVACGRALWAELHHFGDDGGLALKPSDALVVRLCRGCHSSPYAGRKLRALQRDGQHELVAAYIRDALASLEGYVGFLEAQQTDEAVDGCAREELVAWLAGYDGRDAVGAEAWLLAWATRRRANAQAGALEALAEVGAAEDLASARFIAARAIAAWAPTDPSKLATDAEIF